MKPHKIPRTAYRTIKDVQIKIPQDSGNKPVQVAKGIWVIPKQAASDAEVINNWYKN
jgi:hypothetical protein